MGLILTCHFTDAMSPSYLQWLTLALLHKQLFRTHFRPPFLRLLKHFQGMVPYYCCWLLVRAANVGNIGNKPLSCEHCLEMVISRQPGDGGSQPMVATFVCNKSIKRQPQLSAPDNTLYFSVQEVLIVQCPAKPKPWQSSHYTHHFSFKNV